MPTDQPRHPGINTTRINPKGWVGLVFAIGIMFLFLIGLPQIRWFFVLTLPVGALVGGTLYFLHRR